MGRRRARVTRRYPTTETNGRKSPTRMNAM
jgi:hypothetical protein